MAAQKISSSNFLGKLCIISIVILAYFTGAHATSHSLSKRLWPNPQRLANRIRSGQRQVLRRPTTASRCSLRRNSAG